MPWSLFGQNTVSPLSWADAVLKAGGWPRTKANEQSLIAWAITEAGGGSYNPLNSTQGSYPVLPGNPAGVKDYPDWGTGISETVATLNNGYYPNIVADLASGKGIGGNASANLLTWSGSAYSSIAANWAKAAAYLGGKSAPLPAGAHLTSATAPGTGPGPALPPLHGHMSSSPAGFVGGATGALKQTGALLHGTAIVLDRAFALFAPGQGWRIVFGATAVGAGAVAVTTLRSPGDSGWELPTGIAAAGTAALAAFFALRPWPQASGHPIKPGAYVVDVIKGQPPPAGPPSFSVGEVQLTEAGLAALVGLWAAGKAAQGASAVVGVAGAVGAALGRIWGWVKSAGGGAATPGEGDIPPVEPVP